MRGSFSSKRLSTNAPPGFLSCLSSRMILQVQVQEACGEGEVSGFNTAFEEVYKAQTGWLISDERLREDVRTKASMWVIQAYRSFYSRHENSVSERYIKYSTDDFEKLLLDLFAGSSKSLNNSYRR
ncbi:hypothetical protein Bca52824_055028 [Brassica carinata]|uniref:Exocyst subunit Exo70 family protein n=1 Tax=Brassica carinata TaxID=52824 RepID=A0A8X7R6U2_BRACI|nr:hypothetical protein Bca52824_055028 [Brassica carinata]